MVRNFRDASRVAAEQHRLDVLKGSARVCGLWQGGALLKTSDANLRNVMSCFFRVFENDNSPWYSDNDSGGDSHDDEGGHGNSIQNCSYCRGLNNYRYDSGGSLLKLLKV